jgi:hypothetical protein
MKPGVNDLPHTGSVVVDLPLSNIKRWVARRKAMVVNGVLSGAISLEEACSRYELSVEEFLAWQRAIETHGLAGLHTKRLQTYRDTPTAGLTKLPAAEGPSRRLPGVPTCIPGKAPVRTNEEHGFKLI